MAEIPDLHVILQVHVPPILRHLPGIMDPRRHRRFRYWIRRLCDPRQSARNCIVCYRREADRV